MFRLTLALLIFSFTAARSEEFPKLDVKTKVARLASLKPYTEWKRQSVHSLSSPKGMDVPTGHPQSLIIEGDKAWLSTKGSKFGAVFYYNLHRTDGVVDNVYYHNTLRFKIEPGITHAGGMTFDKDRTHLLSPVAATFFGDTSVLKFPKDVEVGAEIPYEEVARFDFHLGALLYDPTYDLTFAIGRDQGFNLALYGNSIYTIDLKKARSLPLKYDGDPAPFLPATKNSYQDCKSLGGDGYFICSAKHGFNGWNLGGTLDVVRFNKDGSFNSAETIHIRVPRVKLDGSFAPETGIYIPGYYGYPPLSYNGFDLEFSKDGKSVTFYFAPNDEPDTNLYIYEAAIR